LANAAPLRIVGVVAAGDQELRGHLDSGGLSSSKAGAAAWTSSVICRFRDVLDVVVEGFPTTGQIASEVAVPTASMRCGSLASSKVLGLGPQLQAVVDQGRLLSSTNSSRSGEGAPIMTPQSVLKA
jgi:hypothetical protein